MNLAALFGQLDLLLPFGKAGALVFAHAVMAAGAGDAFDIERVLLDVLCDRVAAGIALVVIALREVMSHGDALIKDETIALPKAAVFGLGFEIF